MSFPGRCTLQRARHAGSWRRRLAGVVVLLCLAGTAPPLAAQLGQRYALLIGGLGGSEDYTATFQQYLFETRRALVETYQFPPEHVVVLAEPALRDLPFVNGVSMAENIRAQFAALAEKVTEDDVVYVLLFGHGSFDGQQAQLNLPRRDLNDADYAALVATLPAGQLVFVNTASASAPFIEALSAPDRIIITATKSGTQRNETVFPKFFVEALSSPAADLDKNGDLSVQEVFVYAAEKTARSFSESGHLATEHPQLEDTGDGQAFQVDELTEAAEGNVAAVTYLRRRSDALVASGGAGEAALPLLRDKEDLERAIAALKSRKEQLGVDAYYAELETLFVQLARLNGRLEAADGSR